MRHASRIRLALIALAALAVLAIGVRSTLRVDAAVPSAAVAVAPAMQFGGMDIGGAVDPGVTPRVYFAAPVTAEVARTWLKLQQKVSIPFANETPLEDVFKYIKDATRNKDDEGDHGLPIYVDPVGLQEAEKTEQSPIRLELEGIPLATSLTLILNQLGLSYHVQKDGLVIVTNAETQDDLDDPSKLILDRLSHLQAEVSELRKEVSILRGARPLGGGMGGGRAGGGFQ